jgi:hypothetical protein
MQLCLHLQDIPNRQIQPQSRLLLCRQEPAPHGVSLVRRYLELLQRRGQHLQHDFLKPL